jgi:hypothetical protein
MASCEEAIKDLLTRIGKGQRKFKVTSIWKKCKIRKKLCKEGWSCTFKCWVALRDNVEFCTARVEKSYQPNGKLPKDKAKGFASPVEPNLVEPIAEPKFPFSV